jgi:endonuclease/exonuclease/phosphatase family metal-dependent hydrolase
MAATVVGFRIHLPGRVASIRLALASTSYLTIIAASIHQAGHVGHRNKAWERPVGDALRAAAGDHVCLAGDLNVHLGNPAAMDAAEIAELLESYSLVDAYRLLHPDISAAGATRQSGAASATRLDYIFLSQNLADYLSVAWVDGNQSVFPALPSTDHRPVLARMDLPDGLAHRHTASGYAVGARGSRATRTW